MTRAEKVLKAAADKNRLRILKMLERKRMCVCELAAVLGIAQPSVSRHLKKLHDSGLIDVEQEGYWRVYFTVPFPEGCARDMLFMLRHWLNDDPRIKDDLQKASTVCREDLCCEA